MHALELGRYGRWVWGAVLMAMFLSLPSCMLGADMVAREPTAAEKQEWTSKQDYDMRVRQHGDSVKFVFTQPEGVTYRIDGSDYKMPAQVSLRWRRNHIYPLNLKIDNRVYNGEVEVLRTNAGTKMGLITVDHITPEKLRNEVDRGEVFRVRFEVLREAVAEIRLGNREEIERDSIKFTFPGVEKEVERERDLANAQEREWNRWTKLQEYSVPDAMKGKIRKAEESLKRAQELTRGGRNEDAADAYEEARNIYHEQFGHARKETELKQNLNRAREDAVAWQESWNRWWTHNADPKIPDAIDKASEEFGKAEKAEFEEKLGAAAEAFNGAAGHYRAAFEESRKTARTKTVDQAKAEATAYREAWTKWREGKSLKREPLDITKAPDEVKKAEAHAADAKEKLAVSAYEMARERYRRGLEEAKAKVRDAREMEAVKKEAESFREDWMNWEKAQKPSETDEIKKAKEDMEEAARKEAGGDFRDAGDLYRSSGLSFDRAFKSARDKARSGGHMEAMMSVNRYDAKKSPCDSQLSWRRDSRSYEGTLEFLGQKYYLSFRVLAVTEYTRIGKVMLGDITQRILRQVVGGKPYHITYRLGSDKPVLELAIGNRPPE